MLLISATIRKRSPQLHAFETVRSSIRVALRSTRSQVQVFSASEGSLRVWWVSYSRVLASAEEQRELEALGGCRICNILDSESDKNRNLGEGMREVSAHFDQGLPEPYFEGDS